MALQVSAWLTRLTVFLVGNGSLIILSIIGDKPLLALLAIPWSLAALVALSTLFIGVPPSRGAAVVLLGPLAALFSCLAVLGDGAELFFVLLPPVCAVATGGWLIHRPRQPINAVLLAVFGVGFPLAVIRSFGGESGDLFGFRPAEDRMLTWMAWTMLAWGWLSSLRESQETILDRSD